MIYCLVAARVTREEGLFCLVLSLEREVECFGLINNASYFSKMKRR